MTQFGIMYILKYINVAQNYMCRDQRPVELIKVGQDNQNIREMLRKYMEQQLNPESTVQYIYSQYV